MQTIQTPMLLSLKTRFSIVTNAQISKEWEPKPTNPLDRLFGKPTRDVARVVLEKGKPKYYLAPNGSKIEVLSCDYGFRQGGQRIYQGEYKYGNIPKSVWDLGMDNLSREMKNAVRSISDIPQLVTSMLSFNKSGIIEEDFTQLAHEQKKLLAQLKLDPKLVDAREEQLKSAGVYPKTHPLIHAVYRALCIGLDVVYRSNAVRRFWVLEVVARMPYFAYIAVLHAYESCGWWRAGADLRKVHFAEEWNEMHHMEIMESLGGDVAWLDRFVAYHAAMAYFWVLVALYLVSPAHSYDFSTLVETHAYETYSQFIESNKEVLEKLPAPLPAVQYYLGDDVYMFNSFQTGGAAEARHPTCVTLLDTFKNIRDDEGEHVSTMVACHDAVIGRQLSDKYGPTGEVEE